MWLNICHPKYCVHPVTLIQRAVNTQNCNHSLIDLLHLIKKKSYYIMLSTRFFSVNDCFKLFLKKYVVSWKKCYVLLKEFSKYNLPLGLLTDIFHTNCLIIIHHLIVYGLFLGFFSQVTTKSTRRLWSVSKGCSLLLGIRSYI